MVTKIDVSSAQLDAVVIHRVGNRSRDEGIKLSERVVNSSDQLDEAILRNYLLTLAQGSEEFEFHHESDIDLNAIKKFSTAAVSVRGQFVEQSQNIARHLYSASTHSNIMMGELIVMSFSQIFISGQQSKALGIVKTELKDEYIDILDEPDSLQAIERTGVPLNRIQKGALILHDANLVYIIDTLGQKSKYWITDFLKVMPKDSPEARARAGGLVLKSVANAIADTSERLALGQRLKSVMDGSDSITVGELRELSEAYLGEQSVSNIFAGVREKSGILLEDRIEIETQGLDQYAHQLSRKIPLGEGVSIVVSGRTTEVEDISVTRTKSGIRVVAEFKLARGN